MCVCVSDLIRLPDLVPNFVLAPVCYPCRRHTAGLELLLQIPARHIISVVDTDRQRHRQKQRETATETDTKRHRESQRTTRTHTHTHTQRERERERERESWVSLACELRGVSQRRERGGGGEGGRAGGRQGDTERTSQRRRVT